MGRVKHAVVIAIALFVALSSARAIEIDRFEEAGWEGVAMADEATGRFSSCIISATYNSGASLYFRLGADYDLAVGLAHPDWLFRPGERIPTVMSVDRASPFYGNGVAVSTKALLLSIEATASNYQLFRRGLMMKVEFRGRTYQFRLDGTSRALDRVLACVQAYAEPADRGQTPQQPAGGDRYQQRVEALEIATNIAAAVGMQGFRVIRDASKRQEMGDPDVLWQAEGMIGIASVVDDAQGLTLDSAAALVLGGGDGCAEGRSVASKRERVGGIDLVYGMVDCRDTDGSSITMTKIVSPREAGGFFVFSFAELYDTLVQPNPPAFSQNDIREAAFSVLVAQ